MTNCVWPFAFVVLSFVGLQRHRWLLLMPVYIDITCARCLNIETRNERKTSIIIHSAGNLNNKYRDNMNSVYGTRGTKQKENELEIL